MDEVLDLKKVHSTKINSKSAKYSKPYWNENLSELWNQASNAEKSFIKCTGNKRAKQAKRTDYQQKRRVFDRALRKEE